MWAAIVTLGTIFITVWTWWDKESGIKAKEKADVQKDIDAISNADDVTRMADRLRNK